MSAMDDYFDGLSADSQAAFERIRALVAEIAPEAEEGTAYGIPAFRYKGKPLLGFRAAKAHLSVFPFSAEVVETMRERLSTFDLSKGTIRFTSAAPVPDDAVRDLVTLRMREIVSANRAK